MPLQQVERGIDQAHSKIHIYTVPYLLEGDFKKQVRAPSLPLKFHTVQGFRVQGIKVEAERCWFEGLGLRV